MNMEGGKAPWTVGVSILGISAVFVKAFFVEFRIMLCWRLCLGYFGISLWAKEN